MDISIEAAPILEAFEADLLTYYMFGSMVLDRLAAIAVHETRDGGWDQWLTILDGGKDEPVRWNARELDLDLRTVRNKLAIHLGDADRMSWGYSGPGLTTFGRVLTAGVPASASSVADVERLGARLGLPLPSYEAMITQPWMVADWLHGHARQLDKRGRDIYRQWAGRLGLHSAPLNDVTWKVVELARYLSDARADLA